MGTDDGGHRSQAIDALAGRDHVTAGDEYTRAGWQVLAEPRPDQSPFEADERGWVGEGLQYLTAAAVAYRVAGVDARATRRAVEGITIARDLETALDTPVQRACLREFVADFRAVGDTGDVDAAYRQAIDAYQSLNDVESVRRWATSPLFEAAAATVRQMARTVANGEIAIDWGDLHGSDVSNPGAFLAERAQLKRQRFRSLIARVVEGGWLAASRGTTEYGNATFRCPECESTDVNWIANHVLCLRCSAPMTER
ncbi:MAG: hypothetical protein ABEI27_13875 [Halobellus sp.]|uniref:hypothetical protein n=1 Tax=Halobellus sp. TaxID=1979212 RepID=UPI0035D4CC27